MAHPNLSSMAGAPDPKGSQPPPRLETAPQSQPNPRTVPVLQNMEAIEGILLRAFMRLESNEVLNAMMPQIPPLEWDIQEIWSISIPVTPFEAIATAQLCWESLMNRALKFYRRICFNQTYCPSLQRASGEIPNQQTYFLQQLAKFHTCFKPLLDKAISSETDEVKSPIALLISVHWRHVHVLVKSLLSNSEMIYDKYIDDFAYIVKTSKQLISNHAAFATRRLGRFTLEIGVIPALHFTATKCRDPNVRRAAIALLFQDPRQEGEYDGVLCARIGRWITACEEDGLPEPPLPLSSPLLRPNVDDALPLSPPGEGWNHTMPVDNETQMDQCVLPKQTLEDHTENTSYTTWHVPEENRFVLTMIEYHIPERYLKAKIQKAVPSLDGTREERESVIAW
ncbi:hypothetical protein IFR04_005499 [Cadophora malorum]|uniref:Uncharacterized protein n=1 Tax=Cadophora malorum TaxID=108018 RepID=A0A8H7W8E5_9HELO|nr:hypothetical protein IFR04_005499 [Cadophora malorum]